MQTIHADYMDADASKGDKKVYVVSETSFETLANLLKRPLIETIELIEMRTNKVFQMGKLETACRPFSVYCTHILSVSQNRMNSGTRVELLKFTG